MNVSVWANEAQIPNILIGVLGEAIGASIASHTRLNSLFMECAFPGDDPGGNCIDKCRTWMRRANADPSRPPLQALGDLLGAFLARVPPDTDDRRLMWSKINDAITRANLSFDGNQSIQRALDAASIPPPSAAAGMSAALAPPAHALTTPDPIAPPKPKGDLMGHPPPTRRIFIGHGRSATWRDLKDFLTERLGLEYDEFNREPTAGLSTKERLLGMLGNCGFAFLVMTAEDEHADGSKHARENVIHEAGLFQGRYGFERAIILLEEGCQEYSNIAGVGQIRFPKASLKTEFEEIRRVLEREGFL